MMHAEVEPHLQPLYCLMMSQVPYNGFYHNGCSKTKKPIVLLAV